MFRCVTFNGSLFINKQKKLLNYCIGKDTTIKPVRYHQARKKPSSIAKKSDNSAFIYLITLEQ